MRAQSLSLCLLLAGAACTSMQVVQPAQVIPAQRPASVLVKERSGEAVEVLKPTVDGDTLRGTVAQLGERYAVALKDISTVRAREPDKARTWIAVVGGVALGSLGLYAMTQSTGSNVAQPCLGNVAVESECVPTGYQSGGK